MNPALRDLYQDLILDHGRHPRNLRRLEGASHQAEGFNPLCGDRLTLAARVEDGILRDIGFEGKGCAISTASASLMTEGVKGRRVGEIRALFDAFHEMVTGRSGATAPDLGKLVALAGVCEFPTRVKCATLPWHTLNAALENRGGTVTTE